MTIKNIVSLLLLQLLLVLLQFMCMSTIGVTAAAFPRKRKTEAVTRLTFQWSDHRHDYENACSSSSPPHAGQGAEGGYPFQFKLMHKNSACSPYHLHSNSKATWLQAVLASVADSKRTRLYGRGPPLNQSQSEVDVPLARARANHFSNYIIEISLGTPPQKVHPYMDTGSDIPWVPCSGCSNCVGDAFDPAASTTARSLACADNTCALLPSRQKRCTDSGDCGFEQGYLDGSEAAGRFLTDQLSFPSASASAAAASSSPSLGLAFGCADVEDLLPQQMGIPGIVGLGRGALSLVMQTSSTFGESFSYCLPGYQSNAFTGSLTLGGASSSSGDMKFTALLSNKAVQGAYYVAVTGISVGGDAVAVPAGTFALDESSGGGTVIDSGSAVSSLVSAAYRPFRDAFRLKTSGLTLVSDPSRNFDTCYAIPAAGGVQVPEVKISLEEGVDLTLSAEQTLVPVIEDGSVACLAFLDQQDRAPFSILGNFQQQRLLILYDLANSRLGFAPGNCP